MFDGGCEEESMGPGWFESSRELRVGLIVIEGSAEEAELGLWMQHLLTSAPQEPARQPA